MVLQAKSRRRKAGNVIRKSRGSRGRGFQSHRVHIRGTCISTKPELWNILTKKKNLNWARLARFKVFTAHPWCPTLSYSAANPCFITSKVFFGAGTFTQGCCGNFRFIEVLWCCGATHGGCHNWINLTPEQSWCSNIIWPCETKINKSTCCWQCQDGCGCSTALLRGRKVE